MRRSHSSHGQVADDRGVVLVWFVLMATIFLGIGAVVVDYSLLLSERQQLQNGADAGALAIATGCAKSSCGNPSAIASQYASLNASDGTSTSTVCGNGPGLTACATAPAGSSGAIGYARVTTSTLNKDGTDRVNFFLGPFLNLTRSNSAIRATSTAVWGTVSSSTVTSFALSDCSFNSAWRNPDGSLTFPESPVLIRITNSTCNGQSINGFEYLLPKSNGTCQTDLVATGPTMTAESTFGGSATCRQAIVDAYNADSTLIVPIFSAKFSTTITVKGFAAFQPCGLWLQGGPQVYNKCPNLSLCNTSKTNANQRICGWFRPISRTDGTLGSTTDYGLRTIKVVE